MTTVTHVDVPKVDEVGSHAEVRYFAVGIFRSDFLRCILGRGRLMREGGRKNERGQGSGGGEGVKLARTWAIDTIPAH